VLLKKGRPISELISCAGSFFVNVVERLEGGGDDHLGQVLFTYAEALEDVLEYLFVDVLLLNTGQAVASGS